MENQQNIPEIQGSLDTNQADFQQPQDFNLSQEPHKTKWFLFIVIAVIVLGGYFTFAYISNSWPFVEKISESIITEQEINTCIQNSDCIVVDYESCCSFYRAINKKYLDEYNKYPEWRKDEKSLELCSVIECISPRNTNLSICNKQNNRCELIYPTDETVNWQTYRNEEFGFEFRHPEKLLIDADFSETNLDLTIEPEIAENFVFQAQVANDNNSLIVINTDETIKISDTEWKISRIPNRTVDFGYNVPGSGPFYVLQTKNNNYLYAFVFAGEGLTAEQNQILSTFKFIE